MTTWGADRQSYLAADTAKARRAVNRFLAGAPDGEAGKGDRVRVNVGVGGLSNVYPGDEGTVTDVDNYRRHKYTIRMDNGDVIAVTAAGIERVE